MNKAEMADRLAARTGLSKSVAKEAVDGVFAAIGEALADGEEVRIAGFGSFATLLSSRALTPDYAPDLRPRTPSPSRQQRRTRSSLNRAPGATGTHALSQGRNRKAPTCAPSAAPKRQHTSLVRNPG